MSRHATKNARASGNLTEAEADATYLRGLRNQLHGKATSERVDEASRRGAQRTIEAIDRALERLAVQPRALQVELTRDQAGQLASAWAEAGSRPVLALDASGLRGVGELLAEAADQVMNLELLRRPVPEAAWADLNAAYAAWRTLIPPAPADEWLIEDTRARGEEALFWGPNGQGYTTDLASAGRYTHEEAERQARSRPTDRAHRLLDVLPLARLQVDRDALRISAAKRENAPGRAAGGSRG